MKSYTPEEMVLTYINNLEDCGMLAKKMGDVAKKYKAPGCRTLRGGASWRNVQERLAFQGYAAAFLR